MIDAIIIGIVAFNAGLGFWRGFIDSMVGIVAVAVGAWLALQYGQTPIPALMGMVDGEQAWLWGVGWFMGGFVIIRLLGMAISSVLPSIGLGLPNRVLGFGIGLLKGIAISCALLIPLQLVNPEGTKLAKTPARLAPITAWVMAHF